MDPVQNPFAPGAGTSPLELAGRDDILDETSVALRRILQGAPVRSQILVGLRGVGKTVLLNRMESMAHDLGFETVVVEAYVSRPLAALLIPPLRKLLMRLDARADLGAKTKMAFRVLRSFMGNFSARLKLSELGEVELGISPEPGVADSGDLTSDLPDLLIAIAEAAQERSVCVCLILDELQRITAEEMNALVVALHMVSQRRLPLVLIGAGLPPILTLIGNLKSYAERMFQFIRLGPLSADDAAKALQNPVLKRGASFTPEALEAIVSQTKGYPYFLQQWGYEAWNLAATTTITLDDIDRASHRAVRQLDESFFHLRFDSLTPREQQYVKAMAEIGGDTQRSGDIAKRLGLRATSLGPLRNSLVEKGIIYSPSHGDNAFTVPLFDAFLRRQLPAA